MTSPLAMLHSEAAAALLERAARCAGTPLSVHYVERNQEGPRILGWGGCRACRHVAGIPGGRAACRQSRISAGSVALRQDRPVVFLCHMGFACVAAPLLPGEGFVMVFGPYVPAGEAQSLEFDAINGLAALTGKRPEAFPEPLDDIHHAPADAPPAVAEWTREAIESLYAAQAASSESVEDMEALPEETTAQQQKKPCTPVLHAYTAAEIAAALAAGDITQARHFLRGCLAETYTHRRVRIAVRRARILAAAAAALEAAERAGLDTARAWEGVQEFVAQCQRTSSDPALIDAAMGLLGQVARDVRHKDTGADFPGEATAFAQMNDLIQSRLLEGITLEEIAAQLGLTAPAITHRLQRKFGMSFSEYVGRMRVEKAKELLRRTKLSATEVARRVGIRDQSNFGKLFKKFTGKTPMQYRQDYARKP